MYKVVLTQKLHEAGMNVLEGKVDIQVIDTGNPREMLPDLVDADGLIIRIGSIDRETMAAARKLKVIGRPGIGLDNVDVEAATGSGIPVVVAPGANTRSVAEHALALILAASKDLLNNDRKTRAGDFFKARSTYKSFELSGKVLGLVGYGNIGKELAGLCTAIGMKVIVHDPFINPGSIVQGYRYVNRLDQVLRDADVVSLHVPLTEKTRNMIGERELGLMKPSAVLINCARGGVIDEHALIAALKNDRLHCAGLDVFSSEPVAADSPWKDLDNVIVTPHMAGQSREAAARVSTMAAEGVLAVLNGEKWPHVANKEAFDHPRWKDGE